MSLTMSVLEEVTTVGKTMNKYSTKRQGSIDPYDLMKKRNFITIMGFTVLIQIKVLASWNTNII